MSTKSYTPLQTLFAQYMFSAFMWAAAKPMSVACETQLGCIMFVETQLNKGADKETMDRFGRVLLHGA
ncbi:hypothetical protein BKA56DRAFT_676505 [Ilyonectria sp. MPI-CAGE-AT-0026]|nr:hypothetical protein BKA56DRAFT_676505 [Ilyonectria sp. MPI-CAGE-AT-0026]